MTLEADRSNWLIDNVPDRFRCDAKIRYRHTAAPADVEQLETVVFESRSTNLNARCAPGGGWIVRGSPSRSYEERSTTIQPPQRPERNNGTDFQTGDAWIDGFTVDADGQLSDGAAG